MKIIVEYVLSVSAWSAVGLFFSGLIVVAVLIACIVLLTYANNVTRSQKDMKRSMYICEGVSNVFSCMYIPLIFFLLPSLDKKIEFFETIIYILALIGITAILICLQYKLYKYKCAIENL